MAHHHQKKIEEERRKRAQEAEIIRGLRPKPAALGETWHPRRPLTASEKLMTQGAASRPLSQPTMTTPFQTHRPASFIP